MSKKLLMLGMLCLSLLSGCTEKEEVFYTVTYNILSVTADIALEAQQPEVSPQEEGGRTPEDPDAAVKEEIRQTVLAYKPMQEGGSYTLAFNHYNSGFLTVCTSAQAEPIHGSFTKMPGASEIEFLYEVEKPFTMSIGNYLSESRPCVQFQIDLTEHFREAYPELKIVRVQRIERTSTPL